MLQLGQTLWLWRRHRGLTQAALAQRARLARPNLSAIEREKRDVTLSTLRTLAAALEIPPGVLADGVPPGAREQLSARLSRASLERVAEAAVRGGPVRDDEERRLADALRHIVRPRLLAARQRGKRPRGGKRNANAAWLWLEAAYPPAVIQSLIQRIADRQIPR